MGTYALLFSDTLGKKLKSEEKQNFMETDTVTNILQSVR